MFEVAELGHKLSKKDHDERVPELRAELLEVQEALKTANFPVIVLISGVDGAGKGETINLLNKWLDPRFVRTVAFDSMSDEERERPPFWRFWRALPPHGRIGIYVGSWYSQPLADHVEARISAAELDASLLRIRAFEKALIDDGALIIKIWLHLSRDAQAARLKKLESDPKTAWRVTKQDKQHLKHYHTFRPIAERTLRMTSTGKAPWIIIEGSEPRYRGVSVGQHLLDRICRHLHHHRPPPVTSPPACEALLPVLTRPLSLLGQLDLSRQLEKKAYQEQLVQLHERLHLLGRAALEKKISSVIVLEGWDAAGKGGLIRRIIPPLDARHYQIIPIASPTDEERVHHYLWRFWRHIPRAGKLTVYDRSWYGRVLVERVEELAQPEEWMRAYTEINDFEEQLRDHGTVLVKFWLHIDKDEQLRRFQARENTRFKQYKITEEDYRNRERWHDYEHAVNDMIERTSTEYAPWILVEGNDKRYARIKALREYCDRLEAAIHRGD